MAAWNPTGMDRNDSTAFDNFVHQPPNALASRESGGRDQSNVAAIRERDVACTAGSGRYKG